MIEQYNIGPQRQTIELHIIILRRVHICNELKDVCPPCILNPEAAQIEFINHVLRYLCRL